MDGHSFLTQLMNILFDALEEVLGEIKAIVFYFIYIAGGLH